MEKPRTIYGGHKQCHKWHFYYDWPHHCVAFSLKEALFDLTPCKTLNPWPHLGRRVPTNKIVRKPAKRHFKNARNCMFQGPKTAKTGNNRQTQANKQAETGKHGQKQAKTGKNGTATWGTFWQATRVPFEPPENSTFSQNQHPLNNGPEATSQALDAIFGISRKSHRREWQPERF